MATAQVDNELSLDVNFNPIDREDGYQDDIRFKIIEKAPYNMKILKSNGVSFLLTAKQAEDLAIALHDAVDASNALPRETNVKVIK